MTMSLVYRLENPFVKGKTQQKRELLASDRRAFVGYTGSILISRMQRFRFLFFLAFFFVFILTVSSVVLYAFGYRFSLARGIFIYTGSITLKSNPQAIEIRIDGETIPKKRLGLLNNSFHVPGLAPGEHFVEVTDPGYSTWQKKATVESGRSTEFWNVLLAKTEPSQETVPSTAFTEKMYPSPRNNEFAVVKKHGTELTIDVVNVGNGSNEQVFSLENANLLPEGEESIKWSPDALLLLVPVEQNGLRKYAIVNTHTKDTRFLETLNQSAAIRSPRWDPIARDFLFYINGNSLFHIDTATPLAPPILVKENIRAYDISGKNAYFISQESGIVYRTSSDTQSEGSIQITTAPILLTPTGAYSLVVYDEKRLVILERNEGTLFVFNNAAETGPVGLKELTSSGVKGTQFSDDGKKLLYFTGSEISAYFLREWEVQPVREPDTTTQVARFSTPLSNVQWTKDYEHILFSLSGSVKVIELDNRDRRNLLDIVTFPEPVAQIVSRFPENRLYFVGSGNAENDRLTFIDFPEAPNLFGFR